MAGPSAAFKEGRHTFHSIDCNYIYHVSIIDYLQDYNMDKIMENYAKGVILPSDKKGLISAVPPDQYQPRFLNFMRKEVIIDSTEKISSQEKRRRMSTRSDEQEGNDATIANKQQVNPSINRSTRGSTFAEGPEFNWSAFFCFTC